MRAIVVFSQSAGDQSLTAEDLARLLKKSGYEPEFHTPEDSDGLGLPGTDLIVAAGGDGTVTKVVMEAPTGATIGVIPLGTANNIGNSLGIGGRPGDIIAGWRTAGAKTIDIWRCNGPWGERRFIEGCGIGVLTWATHHMDELSLEGYSPDHEISMARAALKEKLAHSRPVSAKVTLDDRTLEGRFLLLEMLNFGAVGPRLPLAWSADPSDGLIEIGTVAEDRYNDFCEWLAAGASPFDASPVTLLRSRTVALEWRDARFRIGDDYWPATGQPVPQGVHHATISLASSGPRLLIPQA